MALASTHDTDPLAFVKNTTLFGDLATREGFTAPYLSTLKILREQGSAAALAHLVG
jgi:mannitol 2-dehydrogenase